MRPLALTSVLLAAVVAAAPVRAQDAAKTKKPKAAKSDTTPKVYKAVSVLAIDGARSRCR